MSEWIEAPCLGCGALAQHDQPCENCGINGRTGPFVTLTIEGRPVSQKNSRTVKRFGNRLIPTPDPRVPAWHYEARIQLNQQWHDEPIPKAVPLAATLNIFLAKGQVMDTDNAACAPLDALQHAKIVTNDHQFVELHVYRRRDPARPRVEITIQRSNANGTIGTVRITPKKGRGY